jgi:hypothetical protein
MEFLVKYFRLFPSILLLPRRFSPNLLNCDRRFSPLADCAIKVGRRKMRGNLEKHSQTLSWVLHDVTTHEVFFKLVKLIVQMMALRTFMAKSESD